ncbi:hypothetical protein DIPPA_55829 [Diplonema papillatum]|nr:hypothetical protein DIPPA_55829 [Diplonema papillatum]
MTDVFDFWSRAEKQPEFCFKEDSDFASIYDIRGADAKQLFEIADRAIALHSFREEREGEDSTSLDLLAGYRDGRDDSDMYLASGCYSDMPREVFKRKKVPVTRSCFLPPTEELQAVEDYCDALQKKALSEVIAKAKANHEKALPALKARVIASTSSKTLGTWTEKEFDQLLLWIRDEAPIIIHIPLEADHRMEKLLADTHFRNQFETKISRGTLDFSATGSRAGWEKRIFLGNYDEATGFQRPKYGCLNIVNDPRGISSATCYGNSYLILKKCRLRTTFANCDSSSSSAEIASCEFHAHVLAKYSDAELRAVLEVANRKQLWLNSNVISQYKEVQIHGELRLAENIDLVVVHSSLKTRQELMRDIHAFCRKNECTYVVTETYGNDFSGNLWASAGAVKPHGFLEDRRLPSFACEWESGASRRVDEDESEASPSFATEGSGGFRLRRELRTKVTNVPPAPALPETWKKKKGFGVTPASMHREVPGKKRCERTWCVGEPVLVHNIMAVSRNAKRAKDETSVRRKIFNNSRILLEKEREREVVVGYIQKVNAERGTCDVNCQSCILHSLPPERMSEYPKSSEKCVPPQVGDAAHFWMDDDTEIAAGVESEVTETAPKPTFPAVHHAFVGSAYDRGSFRRGGIIAVEGKWIVVTYSRLLKLVTRRIPAINASVVLGCPFRAIPPKRTWATGASGLYLHRTIETHTSPDGASFHSFLCRLIRVCIVSSGLGPENEYQIELPTGERKSVACRQLISPPDRAEWDAPGALGAVDTGCGSTAGYRVGILLQSGDRIQCRLLPEVVRDEPLTHATSSGYSKKGLMEPEEEPTDVEIVEVDFMFDKFGDEAPESCGKTTAPKEMTGTSVSDKKTEGASGTKGSAEKEVDHGSESDFMFDLFGDEETIAADMRETTTKVAPRTHDTESSDSTMGFDLFGDSDDDGAAKRDASSGKAAKPDESPRVEEELSDSDESDGLLDLFGDGPSEEEKAARRVKNQLKKTKASQSQEHLVYPWPLLVNQVSGAQVPTRWDPTRVDLAHSTTTQPMPLGGHPTRLLLTDAFTFANDIDNRTHPTPPEGLAATEHAIRALLSSGTAEKPIVTFDCVTQELEKLRVIAQNLPQQILSMAQHRRTLYREQIRC